VTYSGGTTGERFTAYLRDHLISTLKPGDIVVMDNLRSHHVQSVREVFEAANIQYLYLTPHSPDLNEKLNPPAMLGRLEEDVSGMRK
jgi:transposase